MENIKYSFLFLLLICFIVYLNIWEVNQSELFLDKINQDNIEKYVCTLKKFENRTTGYRSSRPAIVSLDCAGKLTQFPLYNTAYIESGDFIVPPSSNKDLFERKLFLRILKNSDCLLSLTNQSTIIYKNQLHYYKENGNFNGRLDEDMCIPVFSKGQLND